MAGSDKNTTRSSAGGDSAQSTQSIGKAESGAVAGQLLNTLKAGQAKPASHEARLGILVITILVFAFGFLVYHKMDIHQRQLTNAAIKSNAASPSETPPLDPAAALLSSTVPAPATDPLINIVDLSDGSPFTDTALAMAEPVTKNPPQTSSLAAFDESVQSKSAQQPATTEPPEAEFVLNEPSTLDLVSEPEHAVPSLAQSETSELTTRAAEAPVKELEITPPAFGEFDSQPKVAISAQTLPSKNDLTVDIPSFPAEPDFQLTPQAEPSTILPESQSNVADVQMEPATEDVSFPFTLPDREVTPARNETASAAREKVSEEPVLLAMAEPQQANAFDNGFLIEEGTPSAKAPLDDPATFPAFESKAPTVSRPTVAAENKPRSGSKGFNAVAHPGKPSDRGSIRTAAGSGSDGKFSLAAFNYGNQVAPAAPDDGSTFESVVVQNGDNYTKISKRVYGTVRYFSALAVFNQHRIPEPKSMRPGMVVLVPAKEVLEERYPELFADSQPKVVEQAGFLLLDDGSPAYRVGERETISEISQRFLGRTSRWIEIYRLNQSTLSDPNKLKPGTILALPADAVEVNVVP